MIEFEDSIDVVGSARVLSGGEYVKINLHGYPKGLIVDGRGHFRLYTHASALEEIPVTNGWIERQEELDALWDFLKKLFDKKHQSSVTR